ncbi:alpha/beta hydrolase [Reyranella sp.]|uniref:alpha/beta hydrolase n=1 Tax=Reyranella sp. TaxID=1929291 RepID=UPI003784B4FE
MDWGRMSRAERDAAYNNTLAVKNSAELNAEREAQSAEFRRARPGHLDVRYGPRERNSWDLFPAATPNAPCFVFIHGGYWQRNSKDLFANLMGGVHAHGWSAALPGYTLAPDASLTEIVAEINAALDWLSDNGPAHGIAGKVILSGWSAGGHLTAACLGHRRVSSGLAISGVYELGPIRDTYLNEKLQLTDSEIETLSPLRQPMINKPLAITYGTAELPPLVGDSRALNARRAAEHLPGALIPIAGADHFTIVTQLPKPDSELVRQLLLLA